ncbi:hypothetical protein GMA06_07250 [Granulicatella sp. zg-84]|nr:hypothetical protein [Granulicatella sp. zg-84]
MMNIQIIDKKEYVVSVWSGGKTTQICLAPPHAKFEVGEFDYRVSSATINLEKTVFTSLPNYNRIIMPIQQTLTLQHPDISQKKIVLQSFEIYFFNGDMKTVSYGKCVDFNVIYKPTYKSEVGVYNAKDVSVLKKGIVYILFAIQDIQLTFYKNGKDMVNLTLPKHHSLHVTNILDDYEVHTLSHIQDHVPVYIQVSICDNDYEKL